jgi:hypothetical protein
LSLNHQIIEQETVGKQFVFLFSSRAYQGLPHNAYAIAIPKLFNQWNPLQAFVALAFLTQCSMGATVLGI